VKISARLGLCGGLLAAAVILGGGGSPAPASELLLQLIALVVLGIALWLPKPAVAPRADWPVLIGSLALILLFVAQLVPLPPSWWQSLPGRAIEAQSLALVGGAESWMPLSVSPQRTLASLLSLIPPLTLLFLAWRLTPRERIPLLAVIGALGVLTSILGVIQLAGGDASWGRFYSYTHIGYLTGFQANRNATADILLIAILALTLFAVELRDRRGATQVRLLVGVLVLLLALSVILTGSRAGIALLGGLTVIGAAAAVPMLSAHIWARRIALLALPLVGLAGFALYGNSALDHSFGRFSDAEEGRTEIWKDARFAMVQHWPIGTGIGTFVPVFIAAERLEAVDPTVPNRAHNDYLEFALEAALPGVAFLALATAALFVRCGTIWRRRRDRTARVQAIMAVGILTIVGLHSLVDYPMRSMSVACLTALAIGLLTHLRTASQQSEPSEPRR
jgi:O-antigen ligase